MSSNTFLFFSLMYCCKPIERFAGTLISFLGHTSLVWSYFNIIVHLETLIWGGTTSVSSKKFDTLQNSTSLPHGIILDILVKINFKLTIKQPKITSAFHLNASANELPWSWLSFSKFKLYYQNSTATRINEWRSEILQVPMPKRYWQKAHRAVHPSHKSSECSTTKHERLFSIE